MHVRRGRYLVDQTINNAGEEARRKQHTQEVHLDQGYPPEIPAREQIEEGDTGDPMARVGELVDVSFSQCYR